MFFLDFVCDSSGLMKLVYFVKVILNIICIVTPVIIIVSSMIHLVSQLIKSEVTATTWNVLVQKIVLGIAVFLVFPLVNSIMVLLNQDSLEDTSCWTEASLESISRLESAEQAELEATIALKQNEKEKEKFENQVNSNINGSGGGGGGSWGSSGGSSGDIWGSSGGSSGSSGSSGGSSGDIWGSSGGSSGSSGASGGGGGGSWGSSGSGSGSLSYGSPCTNYVSYSSFNSFTSSEIITKAKKYIGTSYSKMDCSDFVSTVYSNYLSDSTAAGLAQATKNKCVVADGIRPGDVFFISQYDSSGTCRNCVGDTYGDRCSRWSCILHVGIVLSSNNGKIVSIIHSSTGGVQIKSSPSYRYSPNSNGNSWYIMVTRPYA